MRQLFSTSESDPSAVGGIPPEREKEISWSLMTSNEALQARSNRSPSLQPQGTPIKKISSKQGKLLAQLEAAERDSAAANACRNDLRSVISPPEEKLSFANTSRPQASAGHSDEVPDSNSAANTPGLNKSLGSCGAGILLSDMAALRRNKQLSRLTFSISDGTPSLLTDSSMLAITISTSARSSLSASKYSSVPHGYLPINDSTALEDRDMFSMDHRIPLGEAGHLWYLSIGIDWLADKDSRGTMLTGMLSVMETFPLMIDGFQLHPLAAESSLPVLTSNQADKGFPQSAIMMFRYFHVKNKMNFKGAPQAANETTATSPNKYDDDADFKPSNTLWGTVKVRAKENVKEAVESLS
jgi:hypothetical protein